MSVTREVAGFPTHVAHLGQGDRPALLIHCTLGHVGSWAGLVAALGDRLAMTAFDRPGHGLSGAWEQQGDGTALHALTTEIAAALIDEPVDVIGHSFGATVALRLAMEHPGKVRSLVLIEPVTVAAIAGSALYDEQVAAMKAMKAAYLAGDPAGAARAFHESVNPELPWEKLSDNARARFTQQIGVVAAEVGVTIDDSPGLLAPGRLEAIAQKVLLIEGEISPPAIGATQTALAGRLADLRRVTIPGAGHMSPLTHAPQVGAEIADFLGL